MLLPFSILLFYTERMESANVQAEKPSKWQKTPAANLVRYEPTGKLYARVRVGGKLFQKCLKTRRMDIAQPRLSDYVGRLRESIVSRDAAAEGRMTFGQASEVYKQRTESDVELKPRSKVYRRERLAALLKSWQGLEGKDVRKVSKHDCLVWAGNFCKKASPTAFNNTVSALRAILDIAIEMGALYDNPAAHIKRVSPRQKDLRLPSSAQFQALVQSIENNGVGASEPCANLVRFLAFSGCRISEAQRVTWGDCDFERTELIVRGDAETGCKNGEIRRVPMIEDIEKLLRQERSKRAQEPLTASVNLVATCQGAITSGCKRLGIGRITHHDLRHLFATRCIEAGVDIPTVSRWLGHKDGGALAMKTYGHLRNEHSLAMARRVTFQAASESTETRPSPIPLPHASGTFAEETGPTTAVI
jgi:integrase